MTIATETVPLSLVDWNIDASQRRWLGVLGGMGPLASAQFMARLTLLTQREQDQGHVPTVLWSDPRIPDRTEARLNAGEDPLPGLVAGTNGLMQAGAKAIVIPCNSAHLWHDALVQATGAHILHIVHAVVTDLKKQGIHDGCVGLMGATATLNLGLYHRVLEPLGYTCIQPESSEQDAYCMRSIMMVKANQIETAYPLATHCAERLKERGARAIILGCTEFAIAIPPNFRAGFGLPLIDSVDALARAAIDWYYV